MHIPAYDKQKLYSKLDAMHIHYTVHNHAPVFTVDDASQHTNHINGIQIKNLFVYDKKKTMWVVTIPHNIRPDLKKLRLALGAKGNLSFCNYDRLWKNLGVKPGSVTPLSVINDTQNCITAVLDITCTTDDIVCPHPLSNDATLSMRGGDLVSFMQACKHDPIILNFEDEGLVA